MKRRVAYFLLCACFCFSSLSLNCFAVDQDSLDEGYIYDPGTGSYYIPDVIETTEVVSSDTLKEGNPDMLDYGWLYDAVSDSYYMPYYASNNGTMSLLLSEPNYDFDPNDFPWSSMPSNIQDIVYASVPNMSATDFAGQVPFVSIIRTSTFIRVFCGWNICLGVQLQYNASSKIYSAQNVGLYTFTNLASYSGSVLYFADYNLDMSPRSDWSMLTPNDYGSTGYAKRYDGFSVTTSSAYDIYVYGGNFGKAGSISSFKIDLTPSTSDGSSINHYAVRVVTNPTSGFAGGSYISNTSDFISSYFSYFCPKTAEQVAAETQKGIWDTLKSIPEMIGEKLKSLFVPAEGYFDSYTNEFKSYFEERFGILYEFPELIIAILRDLSQFDPQEGNYSIHFPEVSMPVLYDGIFYDRVIIEERDITFDFLEEGAFKTLYDLYISAVWLIYIVALINLIIRKAEKVFGGSA